MLLLLSLLIMLYEDFYGPLFIWCTMLLLSLKLTKTNEGSRDVSLIVFFCFLFLVSIWGHLFAWLDFWLPKKIEILFSFVVLAIWMHVAVCMLIHWIRQSFGIICPEIKSSLMILKGCMILYASISGQVYCTMLMISFLWSRITLQI